MADVQDNLQFVTSQPPVARRSLREWLDAFRSELVAEVRRGRRLKIVGRRRAALRRKFRTLVLDWKANPPMIQAQMVALRGSDEEWYPI